MRPASGLLFYLTPLIQEFVGYRRVSTFPIIAKRGTAMPAYLIALRKEAVRNPDAMAEYQRRSREIKASFDMVPRVVYGEVQALEGAPPDGVILLEFPTAEEARAWYDNPEYQDAVPFRQQAADYDMFIVDGL
mgnify:CR=1 FL=1